MAKALWVFCLCILLTKPAGAAEGFVDYTGPFTTKVFYDLCSRSDAASKEKCGLYIQGLTYGVQAAVSLQKRLKLCPPDISTEAARAQILKFIAGATGGRPETNADGGDWMAFMGLVAGHAGDACK